MDYHWLLMVANQERVNADHLSQDVRSSSLLNVPFHELVPNQEDRNCLQIEFQELIGRVLVSNFTSFGNFSENVQWHLPHQYSREMALKTPITPLGLLDVDEKKTTDMMKAMRYINEKYVPYVPVDKDGKTTLKPAVRVIVTGDQMTKQNSDSALKDLDNSPTPYEKIIGVVNSIADFHCSMNFNDVIYREFYNVSSFSEVGTLFHLRNLTDRRDVSASALGDHYRANDTFIKDVTDALIITAGLDYFGIDTVQDLPKQNTPPTHFSSSLEKQQWFDTQLARIVERYIMNDHIPTVFAGPAPRQESQPEAQEHKCHLDECVYPPFRNKEDLKKHVKEVHDFHLSHHTPEAATSQTRFKTDGVYNYHTRFLKMAMLERNFQDSVKEGDGGRTCRLWKFKMLHFYQKGRTKYSLEALKLQLDLHALLSPSEAHRLRWNRTVNVIGGAGNNISLDMNCEHYILYTKECISQVGANINFEIAQSWTILTRPVRFHVSQGDTQLPVETVTSRRWSMCCTNSRCSGQSRAGCTTTLRKKMQLV